MFDKELALEVINLTRDTIDIVLRRTEKINSINDFLKDETGVILLDSVCMKLIALGESVKNLDKITNKELLINYPEINWKDIMGMRDIIAHHYFDIDADVVFQSLKNDLPLLLKILQQIQTDLV